MDVMAMDVLKNVSAVLVNPVIMQLDYALVRMDLLVFRVQSVRIFVLLSHYHCT
jgi:hypothetical protein